jgi:hypothetical protein
MAKVRFDQDTLKRFFALHVEKIVLGVILLLAVGLVYTGYSLEGLDTSRSPDALKKYADVTVQGVINDNAVWPQFADQHRPPTGYVQRVKDIQVSINSGGYRPEISMMPTPIGPSGEKRTDPDLLAPRDVEVLAITAAVPYVPTSRTETDPLQDKKDSVAKQKEQKKAKPKKKRRGGAEAGMEGMMGMGDASAGGMEGMAGYGPAAGMSAEGEGGVGGEGMSPYGPAAGMGGPAGMGGTAMAGAPVFAKDVEGFRAPPGAVAKAQHIVAIKALVPYKEQWNEFESKLSTAMDYNPARDVPMYVGFLAERAEVTGEDDKDLKWKPVSSTRYVTQMTLERKRPLGGWAGRLPEVADPRYTRPGVLTMPVPPLLMQSNEAFSLHSKVPRAVVTRTLPKPATDTKDDKKKDAPTTDDPADVIGEGPLVGPAAGSRMGGVAGAGYPGAPGMGMDPSMGGMAGMGAPGMGMAGMEGVGMAGMGSMPGAGMGMPGAGMAGMGMAGMGMPGAGGMGLEGAAGMGGAGYGEGMSGDEGGYGGMGMPMGGVPMGPQVDTLMVRFFDFTAVPGKKYRYRVQVFVADPNHPQFAAMDPNDRALSQEVKTRLQELQSKEKDPNQRQFYYRTTAFSDPSPIVMIQPPLRTLAGPIMAAREATIRREGNEDITIPSAESSAKVMSVVWDPSLAVNVPGLIDAMRGTLLNFKANADVIHPVTLRYKNLEGYSFTTQRLVVDFEGGQQLPEANADNDEPLLGPSELLLMDANGQFVIRNEFDDWDDYQRYLLPEVEASSAMPNGGEGMGPAMGPDMMSPADAGGASGRGRRGGRRGGSSEE